ncbi:hypothetical protein [Photobacterium halotolerans]|uniref:Uncharacterized protein n=1 Tax=Photobacterium halotolerans TaxID=265726 RepID=A0A0F5VHT0_9GAMM|nr:hypothetical protein [Photobacterium halotolerans]KKD01397.1 hypothetical protein KY46_00770 [Photobacterium halotolerans]
MMLDDITLLPFIQEKGWTLKSLGKRWGLSERQMSRLVSQVERKYMDAINGLPERIELKVARHPSGRLTLMTKKNDDRVFTDCKQEKLFGNKDEVEFYRHLAVYKKELEDHGLVVDVRKLDWLFIPSGSIENFDNIYCWLNRWVKNKTDDETLQASCESALRKAFDELGLVYDIEEYGSLSFDNLPFLCGSDGLAISEHFFITIPKLVKRLDDR